MRKLIVVGLDCADPHLVFDRVLDGMPTVRALLAQAEYGVLRSAIPPITIPAWMCMLTGKDPGELGIYGFEHRTGMGYTDAELATSALLRAPAVWDTLGRHGFSSIVLGVPMTYPPKPIRGAMISGLLTPGETSEYAYPASLKQKVESWVGPYRADVEDFRHQDRARLISAIRDMTDQRFRLARRLAESERWDLLVMVEMGPDRMHHAFWADADPNHPAHDSESPYRDAIRDYYGFLDARLGTFLDAVADDADLLIVSDHGAQPMEGGVCINEWLIGRGDLALDRSPERSTRIGELIRSGRVDWSRTRAWGTGGYCGRLFLNVRGRQPNGKLAPRDVESYLRDLTRDLEAMRSEPGDGALGNRVFRPIDVYRKVNGLPPDLIVYFGDLAWRSIGSVGTGGLWSHENDTGPDQANHHPNGLYIRAERGMQPGRGEVQEITSVHRWILEHFNLA